MDANSVFDRLCPFWFYNAVENEAHLCVCVLECSLYNPNTYKLSSLCENVMLGNLKSFFQSDQHVDISLYLMKAIALPSLHGMNWFETIVLYF